MSIVLRLIRTVILLRIGRGEQTLFVLLTPFSSFSLMKFYETFVSVSFANTLLPGQRRRDKFFFVIIEMSLKIYKVKDILIYSYIIEKTSSLEIQKLPTNLHPPF